MWLERLSIPVGFELGLWTAIKQKAILPRYLDASPKTIPAGD
jgi:hypothetical protein